MLSGTALPAPDRQMHALRHRPPLQPALRLVRCCTFVRHQQQVAILAAQAQPKPQGVPSASNPAKRLDCPHFEQCSGCTVDQVDQPPILEEAKAFAARLGVRDYHFHVGAPHGWRCRARLAVRGRPERAVIGLFRAGTHIAINLPQCRVHHPRLNEAVEAIRGVLRRLRIVPYDERSGAGELRYLQLTAVGTQAGAPAAQRDPLALVQVVLVWNASADAAAPPPPRLRRLAAELWRLHGHDAGSGLLHSVWANFQPSCKNTILGPDWRLLCPDGPDAAERRLTFQVLGGAVAAFAPGSFMQVNFDMMDAALAVMQHHVPEGSRVLDLHAGVGVIGLSLAATRRCRWVRAVEVNPQGQEPFEAAAHLLASSGGVCSHNSVPSRANSKAAGSLRHGSRSTDSPVAEDTAGGRRFEYIVSTAAQAARDGAFAAADVITVDPPRKGLEPDLLAALATADAMAAANCTAHTLIYLSCGFASFRQDVEALLAGGAWRGEEMCGYAFFPGANHLESLAVFRRAV